MAYIGNAPADRFTSIPTVQQFNGDGSTTAFTLSRPVGTDQDLLVSVDGVIQDTAAYAVSNGTTLTFSAAPSTGTANIFVNYLGVTIGSVVHPASSALAATTATLSGALSVAMSNDPAQITVKQNGNTNGFIIKNFDGDEAQLVNVDNGPMVFKTNDNEHMRIDATGAVTKISQPAFSVHPASAQNNIAVASNVTVVFGTERFDQNADFASNTFTTPVTGKYQFNVNLYLQNLDSAADYYELRIITSNVTYFSIFDPDFGQDAVFWTSSLAVLADMDADDTAHITLTQGSGTSQTDINVLSTFSGFLAC